jgi:hypothetical protein
MSIVRSSCIVGCKDEAVLLASPLLYGKRGPAIAASFQRQISMELIGVATILSVSIAIGLAEARTILSFLFLHILPAGDAEPDLD